MRLRIETQSNVTSMNRPICEWWNTIIDLFYCTASAIDNSILFASQSALGEYQVEGITLNVNVEMKPFFVISHFIRSNCDFDTH